MALLLDASTPSLVGALNKPWTSASFTPPVDSLLVVVVSYDAISGAPAITVTSTGLTFAQEVTTAAGGEGGVRVYSCQVGANGGTARTVSATTDSANDSGSVKVYVFTGFDTADPIGATNFGTSTTNAFSGSLTTTLPNSWVVGGGTEWNSLGVPTSTDVAEGYDDADLSTICVRKSAVTPSPGAVTLNFDAFGTGAPAWTWAAVEVKEAPTAANVGRVPRNLHPGRAPGRGARFRIDVTQHMSFETGVTRAADATAVATIGATADATVIPAGGGALVFTAETPFQATASVTTSGSIALGTRVAGDYTLLVCSLNASSGVITPPAGWSAVLASTPSTLNTSDVHAIYYRKWVTGDADPVVTCTSGRLAVLPVRVQGADPTTFIETAAAVTQQGVAGTTMDAPTITSTASVVACRTFNGRSATSGTFITWTPPGGTTEIGEAGGQAAAATNASASFNTTPVTPGVASGVATATASSTVTGGMGVSFVVKTASGGGTTYAADATEAVTAAATADVTLTAQAGASESLSAGLTADAGMTAQAAGSEAVTATASATAQVAAASSATSAATIGAMADAVVVKPASATATATIGATASAQVIAAAAATRSVTASAAAAGSLSPAAAAATEAVTADRTASATETAVAAGNMAVTIDRTADASVAGLTQGAATEAVTIGATASAVVIAAAAATEAVTASRTAVATSIDRATATEAATIGATADATIPPRTPIQAAATMAVGMAPAVAGRVTAAAAAQMVSQATISAAAGRVYLASATMALVAQPTITLETTTPRPSGTVTNVPDEGITPRPGGAYTTVADGITDRPTGSTTPRPT